MAKISSYPIISVPTLNDLLIGTDVENLNETKNFSISGITNLILVDSYVPYVDATKDVDLGIHTVTGAGYIVNGGAASDFLKADGSLDSTVYVPETRTLTINGTTYNLSANRSWDLNTVDSLTTIGTSGAATYIGKTLNIPVYQPQGNYITQLSGEATGSGPGNATVTLSNSAVISKVLTGLNVTGGNVVDTDTILQAFGKVQNQINGLVGGVQYQGTWNAATNTPTLQSSVGQQGYYYVVSVAGNTNLNGITDWQLGDWAIYDGTAWQKVDNTDAVVSVNGYTGAVVLTSSDVGAVPTGRTLTINGVGYDLSLDRAWTVGDVRTDQSYNNPSWIASLGWSKITSTPTTLAGYGITDGALNSTTLTINGTTYDLTTDRTWNVGTITSIAITGPLTGGTITGSGTIGITQSGASTDGYLSSTDWNAFNSKQEVISVTAPLTFVAGVVGITQSGSATDGYLSSVDWNTFNNKVAGSGTANTLPMWGSASSLVNSPLSYAADAFNFGYNSTSGGTVNFTNTGLTTYTYSIQMNNFGSPRSTVHSYTDGLIIQSIGGTQVSRMFANGNLILGTGFVDNGYKLEVTGDLYVNTIANAATDTDKFLVSDGGLIKYRTGAQVLSDIGAQGALTLTTIGSSGPATLISNTLNIPDYGSVLIGYVPYSGATQNVNLGEFGLTTGFLGFDLTPTNTPSTPGTMFWSSDDETVDIIMDAAVTQKVGQETFYLVKNQTGSSIPKGTVVRADGTVGGSGRILIAPFLANGTFPSKFCIGVTSETIADGADGFVTAFGKIRQINTDSYAEGTILYASSTSAGGFTTTSPQAPNNIVTVAIVITSSTNNGAIFVRTTFGSSINEDEGVNITSPVTGQLLELQSNGLWENKTFAQIIGGTSSQFVKGDGSLDSTAYQPLLTNPVTGTGTTNVVPKFTGASTIGDSAISDNTSEVSITKRLFLNTGGQSILLTPNLGGSSNRIETSGLPLEITTTGSAIRLSAGGVTTQFNLASTGVVTLTNLAGTGSRIVVADASGNLSASSALSGYVPYTGATGAVDLGTNAFAASQININGTAPTSGSYLGFKHATTVNTGASGYTSMYTFGTNIIAFKSVSGATNKDFSFDMSTITSNVSGGRVYSMPDANGTLALTSDIPANPVGGTGTTNYLPKFTGSTTIGNSQIFDNGTNVGIGTASPSVNLEVSSANTLGSFAKFRLNSPYYNYFEFVNNSGLEINRGGTTYLTISNVGNLLVGTGLDNGARLQVSGAIYSSDELYLDNGKYLRFRRSSGNLSIQTLGIPSGTDDVRLLTTGDFNILNGSLTNLMTVKNGGNVGIGTTSPIFGAFSKLTVGNSSSDGGIVIQSSSTGISRLFFAKDDSSDIEGLIRYPHSTNQMQFWTAATQKMTITSNGNVLIGTTTDNGARLQVSGDTHIVNSDARLRGGDVSGRLILSNSDTTTYIVTNGSSNGNGINLITNSFISFNSGASYAEAMRITSSGNVGIGTTSPGQLLTLGGTVSPQLSIVSSTTTGSSEIYFGDSAAVYRGAILYDHTSDYLTLHAGAGPRIRILSSGNVLIGTTTVGYGLFTQQRVAINPLQDGVLVGGLNQNFSAYTVQADNNTGTRYAMYIANGSSSAVGYISFTSTATSYVTVSDYRLKTDFKDYNGLNLISKIKTYDFAWKTDKSRSFGVIAHELQEVITYAVNGDKDGETMQGVDYSKLVPIMVKAIQELKQEIDTLKNI